MAQSCDQHVVGLEIPVNYAETKKRKLFNLDILLVTQSQPTCADIQQPEPFRRNKAWPCPMAAARCSLAVMHSHL